MILKLYQYRSFLFRLLYSHLHRKHFLCWIKSLQPNYLLSQPSPWFTFDAIDFLSLRLHEDMKIFEYGSGGSTLFWLSKGMSCVSIEHNNDWYKIVLNRIKKMDRIDYKFVPPETSNNKEAKQPSNPYLYQSNVLEYDGFDFRSYVCKIDSYPDNYFDIVSIDGRARPSCIMHSVSKIKIGGMLILDNAERAYYFAETKDHLSNFEKKEFDGPGPTNGIYWKTNIYIRIK